MGGLARVLPIGRGAKERRSSGNSLGPAWLGPDIRRTAAATDEGLMKATLFAAAALGALAFAAPALAQDPYGGSSTYSGEARTTGVRNAVYARADAGLSFAGGVDFDANTTGAGQVLSYSQDNDFDIGWQVGAALGVANFPLPNWRVELEGLYTNNETDDEEDNFDDVFDTGDDDADVDIASADVTIYGGLANLIYDFDLGSAWKPYLGAGAGYGKVDVDYRNIEVDDEVFIWQAKAGVSYALGPDSALEVGYRYLRAESADFDSDDFDLDITGEVDTDIHAVTVGYRFGFGG